jgi:hypothetical protein
MLTTNRVTVIVDDNAVYTDITAYTDLDLSECGIPGNVHALQFNNGIGHIELREPVPNIEITELPEWAHKCLLKWNEAYTANLIVPPSDLQEPFES